MGITRRVLLTSLALSIALTAALLIILASIGGAPPPAEAAGRALASATDGGAVAAAPLRLAAASDENGEGRVRAIAHNLVSPTGRINARAVTALQALGSPVIPFLLPRFYGEDNPTQEAILQVLEAFNEPEVVGHLIDTIATVQSPRMGRRIGAAVHAMGNARCCDQLLELVFHEREAVRLGAAVALRTCLSANSAAALTRQISQDPSAECRLAALESLAAAPDDAAEEALLLAVRDDAADVRLAAVKMLARRRLAGFQDELRRLSRSDSSPQVRKACAQALLALRMHGAAEPEDPEPLESSFDPAADN